MSSVKLALLISSVVLMPLSKARDRERKKLMKVRLESNLFPDVTVQPGIIPNYDPRLHRAGDVVRINGIVTTIPELDADGHSVW